MSRLIPALLAGSLLLATATARAADAPAGNWKLTLPNGDLKMLFSIEGVNKDGKWAGKMLGTNLDEATVGKLSIDELAVTADSLRLSIKSARVSLSFDGKLPPDNKGRILGSVEGVSEQIVLAHLEPSKLTSYDSYALDRETLEQSSDSTALANAAFTVFGEAGAKMQKIENLRGWADKVYKSTEPYGLRWQRYVTTRLALALANQKESYPLAIEYAHKAERLIDDSDPAEAQLDVLGAVSQILVKSGKADDAKQLGPRIAKLEEKDWSEYLKKPAPVKAEAFAGRKAKSDRVALFELFTGAECPPCVAADVAFDALEKTYKPGDVVLLEYHVHVPGPDPLTSADSWARLEYYKQIQGTPTAVVDGKMLRGGGGSLAGGPKSYGMFRDSINPELEKNAEAKIELSATRQGNDLNIKATVSDLAKTGDKIRLRFALVEDHVRYAGGNGQRFHHCVVRSFPGGVNGLALTNKSSEQTAKVNLDELRGKLNEYLDNFVKTQGAEFPRPERPMSLKGLRLVAFIQDDASNDVLQAAQVEIKE